MEKSSDDAADAALMQMSRNQTDIGIGVFHSKGRFSSSGISPWERIQEIKKSAVSASSYDAQKKKTNQ
eukprot:11500812-Ditylum_brightwellii.AAC.1